MQYYDLLSSEEQERIKNEIILDRMEEAEEIQNSLPTGFAWKDDDDQFQEEEQRRREEEERREEERRESYRRTHKPYGHTSRKNNGKRRSGYNRSNDSDEYKPYGHTVRKNNRERSSGYCRVNNRKNHNPHGFKRRRTIPDDMMWFGYGSMARLIRKKDYEEFCRKKRRP